MSSDRFNGHISNNDSNNVDIEKIEIENPNHSGKVNERLTDGSYKNKHIEVSSESDREININDGSLSNHQPTISKDVDADSRIVVESNSLPDLPNAEAATMKASTATSLKVENIPQNRRRFTRSRSWCTTRDNDDTGVDIRLLRERLLRTQPHPQPSDIRHFTRSQKLTLMSLALVDFISFCSMSIMAPFFPREAKEKGMTEATCGFVFSFYALMMFISSPIFGKIAPTVGPKFLFIAGIFVSGSCNLLFGLLEYINNYELFTTFCFLIRGFEALGASAYSTASYVFVVNTFPNNISSVIGILETFIGLGMSIGPAFGGFLYSIGGFGLPFYVLGITMIIIIPINCCLMSLQNDYSVHTKGGSIFKLIKVPTIIVTGLVIMVISNTWAFLDPTLEPHLRQFELSTEQVGLVFMLFSVLYGVFSPIWGCVADRINNLWCMMVWGLLFCTCGLLILGPSPLLPFLEASLTLNIIGLSTIGISVALTLLPTFQVVLTSSIEEGQCKENIATYSLVAGVWSCMYSLGEFIGPSIGGIFLKYYGFPICSTIMASFTFSMMLVSVIFFTCKSATKLTNRSDTISDSNANSENWTSSNANRTSESVANPNSDDYESEENESRPLLSPNSNNVTNNGHGISWENHTNINNPTNTYQNGDLISFDNEHTIDRLKSGFSSNFIKCTSEVLNGRFENVNKLQNLLDVKTQKNDTHKDASSLRINDEEVFVLNDLENSTKIKIKKNRSGLSPQFSLNEKKDKMKSKDFLQYSLNKIQYYNQIRKDDWDCDLDRNQVTDIKGTINLTNKGACEV